MRKKIKNNITEDMMEKSNTGHIQINISAKNLPFYKELFGFLGWTPLYEDENMLGVGDEHGFWFAPAMKEVKNDYDGPGVNHIGIAVSAQPHVDEAVAYLKAHNIEALFETPRHRPEFSHGPENTYYQVMFETPDRILFEIVYTGPLAK
jgi:catechol 2,3-dioxygenase-like lactoylglutathione lyase family enzyme